MLWNVPETLPGGKWRRPGCGTQSGAKGKGGGARAEPGRDAAGSRGSGDHVMTPTWPHFQPRFSHDHIRERSDSNDRHWP